MAKLALIREGGVIPEPGAAVLKADDYAALREASTIADAAREDAAALRERTTAEAAELRRQAREEGLAEGKAEVAEQLFQAVTASVEQLSSMENALVDVVMRSLRTILGQYDDRELAVRVVGQALRLVRDENRVTLRVAIEDADTVRERLGEIVAAYPGMGRVDVSPDASIKPGGCVLVTDVGMIDATLDRQLEIIRDTFRKTLEERPA